MRRIRIEELAEEQRRACWRAWSDATEEQRLALVEDASRIQGWTGTLRSRRSNVSRWFSPDALHPMPAFVPLLLAKHMGRDEFMSFALQALALHRRRPLRAGERHRAVREREIA